MDLMVLAGPVMASPWLYPLLGGMTAADAVLPIIPSEGAVLAAGVFAHSGTPNALLVTACVALGIFTGDHLAYALSRSVLGPRLIHRSKRLTRTVAAASNQLDQRGSLLIVTSRFVPGGRVTLNAACGMTRLPLTRFSPASAVAALAWAAYTVGLGYLGGAAFVAHPLLGLLIGLGLSVALGTAAELICKRVAPHGHASRLSGLRAGYRIAGKGAPDQALAPANSRAACRSPKPTPRQARSCRTYGAHVQHHADLRRTSEVRYRMSPTCRTPISKTRYCIPGTRRETFSGMPDSLLRLPGGAVVGPSRDSTLPSRSFVVVLPTGPVTATTPRPGSAPRWR